MVRTRASRRYPFRRLRLRLLAVLGGIMIAVAAAVGWSLILIPAFIIVGLTGSGKADGGVSPQDRAIVAELGKAWLVALAIAVSGWWTGKRLLRGQRRLVLWLRRFRYGDAARVVSSALDHVGRSWRIVTLDDAATRPVGVAPGLRLSAGVLDRSRRAAKRLVTAALAAGPVIAKVCVAGLVGAVLWAIADGSVTELPDSLPGGRVGRPHTPQAMLVWVFAGVLIAEFVLLIAYIAVNLAAIVLFGVTMLTGSVLKEILAAEKARTGTVNRRSDVASVSSAVVVSSGRILAPRLTVLTVASALWRETVTHLAGSAGVILVDVSEPSENLTWEIREIYRVARSRVVFVGRLDHVRALGDASAVLDSDSRLSASRRELRALLEGRDVLAYTTTLRGRLRFQRALFAELEATVLRPPPAARLRAALPLAAGTALFTAAVFLAALLVDGWL